MSDFFEKYYGIELMGLVEEANLPKARKQTRNNKIKSIDELDWIIQIAKQELKYCRMIPEEDDQKHANLVQELANRIHSAYVAMDEVLRLK